MTAPIRQCGSSHYQAHINTDRETGGGVQGWWLKFMCHALIWCERAQYTHNTHTQDKGKRKGQRSRSVSWWCAVSVRVCVSEWQWSSGVSSSLKPPSRTVPHTVSEHMLTRIIDLHQKNTQPYTRPVHSKCTASQYCTYTWCKLMKRLRSHIWSMFTGLPLGYTQHSSEYAYSYSIVQISYNA